MTPRSRKYFWIKNQDKRFKRAVILPLAKKIQEAIDQTILEELKSMANKYPEGIDPLITTWQDYVNSKESSTEDTGDLGDIYTKEPNDDQTS
jgi:hypothetical protein